MRSVLVHADRSAATAARLETGLALARMTGGHVSVLIDTPVARYVAMDPIGGSYVATAAMNQAIADDDAKAAAIEAQLASQDVPFDVIRSEAETVDALATAARLADVVVTSRTGGLAGDLAMATHTPVLVAPDDADLRFPLERACIAWDGGDEAALALRGAVPLLASCAEVHVLTVKEKPGGFPAVGAMDYLARHGIKAELAEIVRAGSTADSLSAAVAQRRAQLLVMGAYGKSRMREWIFGGVTHHFVEEATGPALLLAH
jgi:nucleotide-binding universal stress UspA family protein